MIERRTAKRRRLIQRLNIYDRVTERLIGKSADVTTKGLLIITDQHIDVGAELDLRVEMPQPIFGIDAVEVSGKVVWRRKDTNPGMYDVGLEFVSLSKRSEAIIAQVIATYSVVS